jgi:hypothetical protein
MDLMMESFCGGNKLLGLKVKHYFSTVYEANSQFIYS